jgi:hypothetical protein
MARKRTPPEKGKRDDVAVKIDRTLADKAKLVASRRGLTLAEYLTELNRPAIERDFAKVIREMGADGPKAGAE